MRKLILAALLASLAGGARAQELKTDEEKTVYAMGAYLGRQLHSFNLSPAEVEAAKRGFGDAAGGRKLAVEPQDYQAKMNELAQKRAAVTSEKNRKSGEQYAEKAAKEKGAVKTSSGLVYIPVKEGKGESPKATDSVQVNYTGRLVDGTVFDASEKHGGPAKFPLNNVIPCWTEGVQKMKVGGTAKLVCPSALAYGEKPPPGIPPGATLVFDVELVSIDPAAPVTPAK